MDGRVSMQFRDGPLRLLLDAPGSAEWNMAVDEAIHHSVQSAMAQPTLRLYRWTCQSLSIGRFQSVERTVHWQHCQQNGIPVVRRLTGGRAVVHGSDITISLCVKYANLSIEPDDKPGAGAVCKTINQWIAPTFTSLGIDVQQGNLACIPKHDNRGNCFEISTSCDLIDGKTGQKVLGSAVFLGKLGLLYQASIPCYRPNVMSNGGAGADSDTSRIFLHQVGISSTLRFGIKQITDTLLTSISEHIGSDLCKDALTWYERRIALELADTKYSNAEWTINGIDS